MYLLTPCSFSKKIVFDSNIFNKSDFFKFSVSMGTFALVLNIITLWEKSQKLLRQWGKKNKTINILLSFRNLYDIWGIQGGWCVFQTWDYKSCKCFILAWRAIHFFYQFWLPTEVLTLTFFNIHINCLRKNAWVEKRMRIWHLIFKSIHAPDFQKLGTI